MAAKRAPSRALHLTPYQRKLLIAHIDGSLEMDYGRRHMARSWRALMEAKLLMGVPPNVPRPRRTKLTEAGRAAVGAILGEAADALVQAGLLEQVDPVAAIRRLQAISANKSAENAPEIGPVSLT